MIMQLGDLVFEGLFSPGTFRESRKWDWVENKVLDTKPHLQKLGTGLHEIELTVKVSAALGHDPGEQLGALYDEAEKETALPLVLGTGTILGEFCILEIQTTWKRTTPEGTLVSAEVSIRLKEYR